MAAGMQLNLKLYLLFKVHYSGVSPPPPKKKIKKLFLNVIMVE